MARVGSVAYRPRYSRTIPQRCSRGHVYKCVWGCVASLTSTRSSLFLCLWWTDFRGVCKLWSFDVVRQDANILGAFSPQRVCFGFIRDGFCLYWSIGGGGGDLKVKNTCAVRLVRSVQNICSALTLWLRSDTPADLKSGNLIPAVSGTAWKKKRHLLINQIRFKWYIFIRFQTLRWFGWRRQMA